MPADINRKHRPPTLKVMVSSPGEADLGDLRIDRDAMTASIDGHVLDLTLQQYEVLLQLVLEEGRPVSQVRLAHALWGDVPQHHKRHISVIIARLRAKLAISKELSLTTVHKRGYALVPCSTASSLAAHDG